MDPVPEDAIDFYILNRSDGLRGPKRLHWKCSPRSFLYWRRKQNIVPKLS